MGSPRSHVRKEKTMKKRYKIIIYILVVISLFSYQYINPIVARADNTVSVQDATLISLMVGMGLQFSSLEQAVQTAGYVYDNSPADVQAIIDGITGTQNGIKITPIFETPSAGEVVATYWSQMYDVIRNRLVPGTTIHVGTPQYTATATGVQYIIGNPTISVRRTTRPYNYATDIRADRPVKFWGQVWGSSGIRVVYSSLEEFHMLGTVGNQNNSSTPTVSYVDSIYAPSPFYVFTYSLGSDVSMIDFTATQTGTITYPDGTTSATELSAIYTAMLFGEYTGGQQSVTIQQEPGAISQENVYEAVATLGQSAIDNNEDVYIGGVAGGLVGANIGNWTVPLTQGQVLSDIGIADQAGSIGQTVTDTLDVVGNPELSNYQAISELNGVTIRLQDVFPFCIPFDLVDMLRSFQATRRAPQFSFNAGFLGSAFASTTIQVDLSVFDDLATILRSIELIGFVIGLAIATREIIRG